MNQNHFSFVQELTGGTGWALGELPVTGRKIVICSPSCCNLHLMELLQLAAYGPLLSLANPCTGLRSTTNRLTAHSWTSHTHPPTDSSSLMNITRVHSQHLKLLHSTSIFTSPAHTPHSSCIPIPAVHSVLHQLAPNKAHSTSNTLIQLAPAHSIVQQHHKAIAPHMHISQITVHT